MDLTKLNKEFKEALKNGINDTDDLSYNIIAGDAYIRSIVGRELDYENDPFAKQLLKDYVRYDYNNAVEYFEQNFREPLLRLSLLEATKEIE